MKNTFQQIIKHIKTMFYNTVTTNFKKHPPEPMTLCIINKNKKGNVQFWSDSRLNYSDGKTIDMGVKVISYPIRIYSNQDHTQTIYNNDWGLCFAGGSQTIYYIKDFIVENLKNVECIPDLIEISAKTINEYVNKIYVFACNKFIDKLWVKEGGCVLITTGYCPKERCFKTTKFEIKRNEETDFFECEPIEILNSSIEFIGSGKEMAQKIYDSGVKNPYTILKKIIDENLVSSVGGQIQFGENVCMNFQIKGVITKSDDEIKTQLRGVDIYDDLFDYTKDLHPIKKYIYNKKELSE